MTNWDLVREFETMADEHWAYEMGAAVKGKVDCSGAFVYALRKYKLDIPYGSNSMWRQSMAEKGAVGVIPLVPGMAVFKRRMDGGEPEKFRGDGIGNLYHVGLYCGDDTVIHAKGSNWGVVREPMDKAWTFAGQIAQIAYTEREEVLDSMMAVVVATSGGTVNLRNTPNGQIVYKRVPIGTTVTVLARNNGYAKLAYDDATGWMDERFLNYIATGPESAEDAGILRAKVEALYTRFSDLYKDFGELLEING